MTEAARNLVHNNRQNGPAALPSAAVILEAMPVPVIAVDEQGRISFINAQAQQFFKSSTPMLHNQQLDRLVPFGSPVLAMVEQVRRDGISVWEYEVNLSTPHIGERIADVQIAPLNDVNGAVLIVLREISIARKMDQQLTHRGAVRSVTGMASLLAHEIKNPLSGIRGAAQLVEQNANEADKQLTRLICLETDRICELVDRMEAFGDQRPPQQIAVNIHQVLEHVRRIAQAGFAKNIRFIEEYDPSLPEVIGDRDQLIQVFLNLVKNAAEALDGINGGEITLTTAFRHGMRLALPGSGARVALPFEVCVRDNGPGVAEDIRAHLFDPFVSTKPNGTGLGLSLVAKIIGDHGGMIECDAQPRRTTFRTLLPIRPHTKLDSGKR
ncbi:MAG: PAS domain-containing protein [Alphaproteobacteria bacterium]|nr:PAS domain-containing protein [Alphaproteobacteria bacterium]